MQRIFPLLLGLILALFSLPGKANHLLGTDITYRCTGNGKYEVWVRVYRDCSGIQISQGNLFAQAGTQTVTVSAQTKTSVRDITESSSLCQSGTRCQDPSFTYGVEEHTWKMTLDLSAYSDCQWTLHWERCCRSTSITTGQSNQNYYNTATLDKCLGTCNSSPEFSHSPAGLILMCHNTDINYSFAVIDTVDSGDSFSYELVSALQGKGSPTSYSGNFSPQRPLNFFGFPNQNLSYPAGFRLDPVTGELKFRPTQQNQVGVIAVEVREWRNLNGSWTQIGSIRRDLQVTVVSCPTNQKPSISGPYSYEACVGNQLCISIGVTDPNQNDSVRISWGTSLPGATFTTTNDSDLVAQGKVCWTPKAEDTTNSPFVFSIVATDNGCPKKLQDTKTFSVEVRKGIYNYPHITRHISPLNCRYVAFDFTPYPYMQAFTNFYEVRDLQGNTVWQSSHKKDTALLDSGTYVSKLTASSSATCTQVFYDTFSVSDTGKLSHYYSYSLCKNESLTLSSSLLPGPSQYSWYQAGDSGNTTFLKQGNTLTQNIVQETLYLSVGTTGNGCEVTDSFHIHVHPQPQSDFSHTPDSVCTDNSLVLFTNTSTIAAGTLNSVWHFGDGDSSIYVSPSHLFDQPGSYRISLTSISDKGCRDTGFDSVWVLPPLVLPAVSQQTDLTEGDTVIFDAGSLHPASRFRWQGDFGQGFVNLMDTGKLSGVHTRELRIFNVRPPDHNLKLRCIVTLTSCEDTSNVSLLGLKLGIKNDKTTSGSPLKLYPNPADAFLIIEYPAYGFPITFEIRDQFGRVIKTGQLNTETTQLDLSELDSGIYLFCIQDTFRSAKPFIIR